MTEMLLCPLVLPAGPLQQPSIFLLVVALLLADCRPLLLLRLHLAALPAAAGARYLLY